MKRKIFTHMLKPLFLLLFALLIAEATYSQLVSYALTANLSSTQGQAGTMTTTGTNIAYTGSVAQTDGWNSGGYKYWQTSTFNTTGIHSIKVQARLYSAANGPRDFALQYKIASGSWTTAANFTLTTSNTNYSYTLPTECRNQASLFVRWISTSYSNTAGGAVALGAKNYIKTVSITGELPLVPGSQANNITIVSTTPTTITIDCTEGGGDNRIIVVNTNETFTDPLNDEYPTANATYGSGEQTVYNGIGTKVVVTVPSATNIYYFRVYDFKYNGGMTRYITSTATDNPKQCALEIIAPISASTVKLASATLGATITTPTRSQVSDRGIVWSTSPGVFETDNKTPDDVTDAGGAFSIDFLSLTRGSTIYYKGYVTNDAGTILSAELSFSNVPIFTGTGNWGDAARWTNTDVPGAGGGVNGDASDNPIINGTCSLASDITCQDLTINNSKKLYINPQHALTVYGTLTKDTDTLSLIIKSDASGTGSLIHNTSNIAATVQRYVNGSADPLLMKYHLVSVPVTGDNSGNYESWVWLHSFLFTYLPASDGWFSWDYPTNHTLNTHEGAMVYYTYPSKTYAIAGNLNNDTYLPTINTAGNGYNLVPNPYPSSMDWDKVDKSTLASDAIWIFNPAALNYQSYAGGIPSGSVNNIIPVGQAFFVKASSTGLSFDNSVRINSTKNFIKSTNAIANVLNLTISSDSASDGIAVRFASDATTGHDKHYDAAKFYGSQYAPQLSSNSENEELSINGLPNSSGSTIVPLKLTMDFAGGLTFTASGMESFQNVTSIKLEDKQLSQLADLRTNPVYTFSHTPQDATDRFVLHFGSVLGIDNPELMLLSKVTVSGHEIYLEYPSATKSGSMVAVYDLQGRMLKQFSLNGLGRDHINLQTTGVYMVKLWLPSGIETHKIVVL
ncbi:MAG: T9SS type A sorting domain-containing protein [Bacteroidales bacterium]